MVTRLERTSTAVDVVRGFPGLRVLIVGEAMLDSWLEGDAIRLCKEGPVPVVREVSTTHCPGGAANAAVNLAALGADVAFVSFIGRDAAGKQLRDALRYAGVAEQHLIEDDGVSTLHKVRVIASGQYVVRFDEGSLERLAANSVDTMLEQIEHHAIACDAIVVSDYGHGAVPDAVIDLVAKLQQRQQRVVVVDSKAIARFSRCGATMVTPNLQEAWRAIAPQQASDEPVGPQRGQDIARSLRDVLDATYVAVTMADHGVLLTGPEGEQAHIPCYPTLRASDVGAGDTFTAAATMALAVGAPAEQAVRIGIDAASIAITRERTSAVSMQDLLRRVSLADSATALSLKEVVSRLEVDRFHGKRIVFTNGVFDILHAGHVKLLGQARALGDVLVVGINSDTSTRRLKGPRRPVNRESDRLALVSALDAVDYALIFEEDTPTELIRAIRPHVHVKGGDYQAESLPEIEAVREVGADVAILSLVDGRSTTALIDRIVATAATGDTRLTS